MSGKLRFQALTDKRYRPKDGAFVIRLALTLGVSDLAETLPLNLCLAIDKSMSMEGAKMEHARESARKLIESLRPEDRLTILAFSSNVETLAEDLAMTDEGRAEALDALAKIRSGGVTRMDLALERAYEALGGSHDSISMLLLLSDGAPTNPGGYVLGEEERESLMRRIASAFGEDAALTSSIGLGDAETCMAPFLERCAESGGGVFYHQDDPGRLAEIFIEELHRVKATAVSEARFVVGDLWGRLRRAVAVYPELRELQNPPEEEGRLTIEAGALQKGEEHVFLLEIVTPEAPDGGKKKLCEVTAEYTLDGVVERLESDIPLLEYTDDENLLGKPDHPDVARYKSMYAAFIQTQIAARNMREGGDAKKTKVLLSSAAKTTRRLGMSKQTKLLDNIARKLGDGDAVSANDLAQITVASRKTKVLNR